LFVGANVSSTFSIGDKVDLLQHGVKVGEGSIFNAELGHKVHGNMVKKGFIVVKIDKVLKYDARLPHPTVFEHTLGGALESYEVWPKSDLEPHYHDHAINLPKIGLDSYLQRFLLQMNAWEQACALPKEF